MTFEYSRMNYYLGSLYSKANNYNKALNYLNSSLVFYQIKDMIYVNNFSIQILINKLNLFRLKGIDPSLQIELDFICDYCFQLMIRNEQPQFSQLCSPKLYIKFQSILINIVAKKNIDKIHQIILINKNFYEMLTDPILINQVAFFYYLINNLEESMKLIEKSLHNVNQSILSEIEYLGLQCNKCMILHILGLHDQCKYILNKIKIDFSVG